MASSNLRPTLSELGAKVKELSETLEHLLKESEVEPPTLAADSPINISKFTPEIFTTKQHLQDAMNDLSIISQGPSESVFNYAHNAVPDMAALNILNRFNFWEAVPLDGSASISSIAQHVKLPEEAVQRLIEHATTIRYFAYANPAHPSSSPIQHTSRSAVLAKIPGLRALVSGCIENVGPSMLVMPDALEQFAVGKKEMPTDMNETAFRLAHSGGKVFGDYNDSWQLLENAGEGEKKGWRQRTFIEWMAYIKDIFGTVDLLLGAMDWEKEGNATVVDIGGSAGHDAFALAAAYPKLSITVEDLHECAPVFSANVPSELASRVTFLEHNFFNPQPVSADIYLLKLILHDWPEAESVEIIQQLRPALKPGARILFIDYMGKQGEIDPNLPRSIHQFGTSTDLRMMALFNARERSLEAWKGIVGKADERFEIARVDANPLTYMVIMEVVWRG
ncbi:S-adenosyl-L-methionine-dependent methyltransferase [Bimuria novae-zelandiae CBS 107.79]|uniref:S-adenosyl-L-methionine-dependent methyltransferase n=1 Tax=Bimuria novae-zelandiae CBS 107.79 TaxID=1447943 RepID=A0A6A5VNH6_9PLEO|nr:S-adenosyl-L-methionine-dependent methyltransferase [Bimuria novae-zelandiae CBS 107.79]